MRKRWIENSIKGIYSLIFFIFAVFTLFHIEKYELKFEHSTWKTLVFFVLAGGLLTGLTKLRDRLSEQVADKVRIPMALCLLGLQILLFLKIMTPIGWDVLEVVNSAEFGLYNGDYFAKHMNNLFLRDMLAAYIRFVKGIPFLSTLRKLELLNLLFADSSIVLLWLCVNRVLDKRRADQTVLYAIFLIAFHPTLSVVYSDSMALPFPIGILCCIIYGVWEPKKSKKVLYVCLMGFLLVFGYAVKPTVVILVIAACLLWLFYEAHDNMSYKRVLLWGSCVLLTGMLTYGGIRILEEPSRRQIAQEYADIKPRGMLFYMLLGLSKPNGLDHHGYGNWNEEDAKWTDEHIDDENYTREVLSHMGEKLQEMGAVGYIRHLIDKVIWMGGDGTFFYGGEGDFHLEEQSEQTTLRGRLQNAFYIETDFYKYWYSAWLQGIWLLICLKEVLSFWQIEDNSVLTAKLSILGLILFLLLFENRSRYLFLYLPVMLFVIGNQKQTIPFRKDKE